jgi:hypothetical protein
MTKSAESTLARAGQEVPLADAAGVKAEAELTCEGERSLVLLAMDAAGDLLVVAVPRNRPSKRPPR